MVKTNLFLLYALFFLGHNLFAAIDDRFVDMVYIKGGEFSMGSKADAKLDPDDNDETPAFKATVASFYMSKYEISYSQWKYVYNWAITNGYKFENEARSGALYLVITRYGQENNVGFKDRNHPVVNVSWYDVIKWCNAKSEMEGLTPLYYIDKTKATVYRSGSIDISINMVLWLADGYYIPTEAQWEYAARAGSKSTYPWGNNYKQMNKYANVLDISANNSYKSQIYIDIDDGHPDTATVDSFAPNAFGLHNMIGNVWEWVFDFHGEYKNVHIIEPRGAQTGYKRVIRGGCFYTSFVEGLRVANRYAEVPTLSDSFTGFRIAKQATRLPN